MKLDLGKTVNVRRYDLLVGLGDRMWDGLRDNLRNSLVYSLRDNLWDSLLGSLEDILWDLLKERG